MSGSFCELTSVKMFSLEIRNLLIEFELLHCLSLVQAKHFFAVKAFTKMMMMIITSGKRHLQLQEKNLEHINLMVCIALFSFSLSVVYLCVSFSEGCNLLPK